MRHDQRNTGGPAYISKDEMRGADYAAAHAAPAEGGYSGVQWAIAGLFLLAFLCTIPFWPAGDDTEAAPDAFSAHAKVAAYSAVKREVLARLKAPATASFASAMSARYAPAPGDGVTVHAYVDSQNGFGANIRTQFVGTAQPAGDAWRVTALDIE